MPRYRRSHIYIAEQFTGKPLTEIPPADFLTYSDDPPQLTIEDWYEYAGQGRTGEETMVANVGDWVTYSGHYDDGDFDNYWVRTDEEFRETFLLAEEPQR